MNQPTDHRVKMLEAALEISLELQSHYARLLNMHDGGARLEFKSVRSWLERLRDVGRICDDELDKLYIAGLE